ncbi:MAG: ABC transporter permease [Candidatus Delongbacteria bacterium]|jgi:putative ABC transport system permease protein|nr:ABC transporter permease [Candidatus Delongbacteria bacterium]
MYYIWESIKISLTIIKENKLRSFLTLLGIMIGVTTIIFVHSVLVGTEKYIVQELSSMGSNTLHISKYSWIGENWRAERKRKPLTIENADFIRDNSPMVEYVSPIIYSWSHVKFGSNTLTYISLIGSTEAYEYTSDSEPGSGRFFNAGEVERKSNVVILGSQVADILFENMEPVGQYVKLNGKKFYVIGVLEKKGEMFGNNMDENVIIPISTLKKYFNYSRRHGIEISVKTKDPTKTNETIDNITSLLRVNRGLKPDEDSDFSINEISQILDFLNKITGSLQILLFVIGSLSLLVGGIGIMNIMLVSVTQRTKEIGTRKALGATKRLILAQFIIESIILCSFGGFMGIIAGFSVAALISSFTPLPYSISLVSMMIGVGFSTLVGVVFGYYPANKAAKLNPINALRYE